VPQNEISVPLSSTEQSAPSQHSWRDKWKHWRELCTAVTVGILSNFIFSLVGEPLSSGVKQKLLPIGICIVLILVVSIVVKSKPNLSLSSKHSNLYQIGYWMLSKGLPISSFLLFLLLLMTVLIRPEGCPAWICPPPQISYCPNNAHDTNLEICPSNPLIDSSWYVISNSPAQYTLANLPTDIGAVRMDKQTIASSYRVILEIHNLHQEGTGIIIEQVDLVNIQIAAMPRPLNVWGNDLRTLYDVRPYVAYYNDNYRESNIPIPATSHLPPGDILHLDPGETEELDVLVLSHSPLPTYLKFQIRVTYSTINGKYSETLPRVFEVAFSNPSNWHPYQFIHGHFVAFS
jgi:hypothetical protein